MGMARRISMREMEMVLMILSEDCRRRRSASPMMMDEEMESREREMVVKSPLRRKARFS